MADVTLDRGDTALLYTDGLIEARRDILAGLSDLKAAAAETATYPPHHLPRVLVERALAGAQRRDDTLALALRRRASPLGPAIRLLGPFKHRFSPLLAAVPVARHLFLAWAHHQALATDERRLRRFRRAVVAGEGPQRVRDAGGAVSMRSITRQLAKLFEITGLTRIFPVE